MPFPQDAARNLLHHVRDTGGNLQADPNLRGFQTNNELYFHTDGGDLFMLYAAARPSRAAGRGWPARPICSTVSWPPTPSSPGSCRSRSISTPAAAVAGQPRAQCLPVMIWHGGRLNILHKRAYIDFAQRFEEVPPLTDAQRAALDLLDQVVGHEPPRL